MQDNRFTESMKNINNFFFLKYECSNGLRNDCVGMCLKIELPRCRKGFKFFG